MGRIETIVIALLPFVAALSLAAAPSETEAQAIPQLQRHAIPTDLNSPVRLGDRDRTRQVGDALLSQNSSRRDRRAARRAQSRVESRDSDNSSARDAEQGATPTSGTYRRAPGRQAQSDDPVDYGRLIVMSDDENVSITIDGEPYPRGSTQGVVLWAGYQYDVVLSSGTSGSGAAAASGDSGSSRTLTVRVRPGETRLLLANLGEGGAPAQPPHASSRRERQERTSRRNDEDEDEDETGYLGVSSTPRGSVYIDGENTGQTTPARRIEMEPGRHEVRIFYDSEERFSETKNVLIRAGVNTNVFFRLRREEREEEDED